LSCRIYVNSRITENLANWIQDVHQRYNLKLLPADFNFQYFRVLTAASWLEAWNVALHIEGGFLFLRRKKQTLLCKSNKLKMPPFLMIWSNRLSGRLFVCFYILKIVFKTKLSLFFYFKLSFLYIILIYW